MADAQIRTDRGNFSKNKEILKAARSGDEHGSGPGCGHLPATEPRSFGPPLIGIDGMSALQAKASMAIGDAGFDLFRRQTQALADYWESVSAARAPWHVFAAHSDYWTHVCRNILAPGNDGVRN